MSGSAGFATNRFATNARLTAAAAGAVCLATLTLSPLFVNHAWLPDALLTVFVVAAVGAGGRALGAPRFVVVVAQLAALAVAITVAFAPDHALAGVVPTSTTVSDLVDLAHRGTLGINQQTIPVVALRGIVLLVALGIGLAAVAVDVAGVACRCPVIAGIPLLCIYGVTAAVLPGGASWQWFVVASLGWLVLLYAVHRDTVRNWGVTVAPHVGTWERLMTEPAEPRAVLARRIGAGAVVSGVVIAALIPGVGDGVLSSVAHHGSGSGTGSGAGAGGSQRSVTLNLQATLQGNLRSANPTPILTYSRGDGSPQYLRLAVLDHFDGTTWAPSGEPLGAPSVYAGPQSVPGLDANAKRSGSTETLVRTVGSATGLHYLPTPYYSTEVTPTTGDWQWDTSTSVVFSTTSTLGATSYEVASSNFEPTASTLASTLLVAGDQPGYTVYPEKEAGNAARIAAGVTQGQTTEYGEAIALQNWFRTNFTYNDTVTEGDSTSAIDSFLANKQGYCQQFAAAYALMARTLGIPARVVVGFAPGQRAADGSYVVGTHDFHAWPEVWFDGSGWVRFEPTPRAGADSTVTVPAYAAATDVTEGSTAVPSPTPTASTLQRPADRPSSQAQAKPASGVTAPVASWTGVEQLAGGLAIALLLLLLAAAPGTVRALRRRRRLGLPPGDAQVEAAWAELADTARDLGLPWAAEDTPRRAADALVRDARLAGASAVAVQSLRHDLEQVRYARSPELTATGHHHARPAQQVATARAALVARSSMRARARALLLPRTTRRRSR